MLRPSQKPPTTPQNMTPGTRAVAGSAGSSCDPRWPPEFNGVLQADGYAGFDRLFNEADAQHPIKEAAAGRTCGASSRIHQATQSPLALDALNRIGDLYWIEEQIRGQPPDTTRQVRAERATPKPDALNAWMIQAKASVSKKSDLADASSTRHRAGER
jgi:hypothetical protein